MPYYLYNFRFNKIDLNVEVSQLPDLTSIKYLKQLMNITRF